MKHRIMVIYAIAFLMLALGCSIYLLFREKVIFTIKLSELLSEDMPNCAYVFDHESYVGGIFLYSLADAMWYGSLLLFEFPLRSDNLCSKTITFAVVVLPFILELLQLWGVIAGTFDMNDILLYVLTLIIFSLCSKKIYCNC